MMAFKFCCLSVIVKKRSGVTSWFLLLTIIPVIRCCSEDYTTSSHNANCSNRQLEHVPFSLHHDIRILDLSNNKLHQLPDNAFFKYRTLQQLYLRNNSLSVIQAKAFSSLVSLQHLNLSGNSLTAVPTVTFSDLTSLLYLSLRGNKIGVIRKRAFVTLTKLNHLYLDGNHIDFIHPGAFAGLRRLQWLELQNNALRDIDPSVMRYFNVGFLGIKLHKNPWFCDCNMRWLPEWLKKTSELQKLKWKFRADEPTCKGPALVREKGFSSLSGELFVCNVEMYSSGHNTVLLPDENVDLFCKYYSDPPVEAVWLKNDVPLDLTTDEALKKYQMNCSGTNMRTTTLHISEFEIQDIGEYKCFVENSRNYDSNTFVVTLEGIDPSAVTLELTERENHKGINVQSAIISASVIGGFMVLLLLIGGIIYGVVRCKRIQKIRRETIRLTFQEHLKANGIIESKPKEEKMYDDILDCPPSLEVNENDPLYNSRNGAPTHTPSANTYISFKSELSEPEDITQYYPSANDVPENYEQYYPAVVYDDQNDDCEDYTQYYPTISRTNHSDDSDEYTQFYPVNHSDVPEDYTQFYPTVRTYRSDGSQCESTSLLLDHISPIMLESDEPLYEPQNIYMPRFVPRAHTLHPHYLQSHPRYEHYPDGDYSTLSQGPHYRYPDMALIANAPHKSASVGNLGLLPPKKPPRLFHSRDSMSSSMGENGTKLSLPKPGTVDQFGTAV